VSKQLFVQLKVSKCSSWNHWCQ